MRTFFLSTGLVCVKAKFCMPMEESGASSGGGGLGFLKEDLRGVLLGSKATTPFDRGYPLLPLAVIMYGCPLKCVMATPLALRCTLPRWLPLLLPVPLDGREPWWETPFLLSLKLGLEMVVAAVPSGSRPYTVGSPPNLRDHPNSMPALTPSRMPSPTVTS